MNTEIVRNELKKLTNKKFCVMFREKDLFCIQFGNRIKDCYGQLAGEYDFHIDCPWRIVRKGVRLSSYDIYRPSSLIVDPEHFNWQIFGHNKFDEFIVKNNNEIKEKWSIKNIDITDIGDLVIEFKNGDILETFIETNDCEEWRFMDIAKHIHYIVFNEKGEIYVDK